MDRLDAKKFMQLNKKHMDASDILLVAMLEGWYESIGTIAEIAEFREADKPVFYIDPDTLEVSL